MPLTPEGLWYPVLFGKQLQVFNNKSRALLCCGPRKSGKCATGDTIVQTGDGLSRLRRLGPPTAKGDYVLNHAPVISFDQFAREFKRAETCGFYRDPAEIGLCISVRGGYEIKTSLIHPLWSMSEGIEDYRQAAEIQAAIASGKEVFLPLVIGHPFWSKTAYKKVSFLPMDKMVRRRNKRNAAIIKAISIAGSKKLYKVAELAGTTYHTVRAYLKNPVEAIPQCITIDEDIGYLIGVLIGDGCLSESSLAKNRIILSTLDQEVLDACSMALRKHFPGASFYHRGQCDWECSSSALRGLVEELCIVGYAHQKTVPDLIIESPKTVVKAFLQGLFDTDGTADKHGRVSFSSSSRELSMDVQRLLLAFGLVSSVARKKTPGRDAFLVELNGASRDFFEEIGFKIARKQERSRLLHPQGTLHRMFPAGATELEKKHLAMGGRVFWRKVTSCAECKVDLYDVSVPKYHSFIGNGFINHNTWCVLHKIVRHLWETRSARVAMFSRTLKNSKEGGTWSDLHTIILPEWIKARIGLRFTTRSAEGKPGPKVDGQTRTPYFKIQNAFGGESELMLFSLDFDGDIEDKLKEQRFSMIYFSELSKFRDRKILSVALPSLRMPHLSMDDQQWIADTNPSEEGDQSWIYDVWYIEKNIDYAQYCERIREKGQTVMPESSFLNFQRGLGLIEIRPEENPFLDPRELEELKSTYSYDEGLYARYVEGKWVYGDGNKSIHFSGKFFPIKHVVGMADDQTPEEEWDYINPTPQCFELITGWDLGEKNHAQVTLEKYYLNGKAHFAVLDELESIGEEIDNISFTETAMYQLERLEEVAGRKMSLDRAWSDNSSFAFKATGGGTYPYLEVYRASNERIYLTAVPKPKDSVRSRVNLLKQLLVHDRLKVSAHCKAVIRMFKHLKKGKALLDFVVQDENKHIFDALTYALLMEMAEELELGNTSGGQRQHTSIAVSIGR